MIQTSAKTETAPTTQYPPLIGELWQCGDRRVSVAGCDENRIEYVDASFEGPVLVCDTGTFLSHYSRVFAYVA